MSKYFFLSYARLDREEDKFECVKKFYNDLVEEVRSKTALPKGNICFFDEQDIEPGFDWPNSLSEALSTSRILVCMYSRTYFTRPHCGREWGIFYSRLSQYVLNSPHKIEKPPLILPVLLGAPDELPTLPEKITRIQFQHNDFPEVYQKEGLRYMIKLGFEKEYALFITKFAKKLIQTAETYPINHLDPFPNVGTFKSAFHEQDANQAEQFQDSEELDPQVRFFFVAGKRQELEKVKKEVSSYGNEGESDWKPYLPVSTEKIAYIAQGIAHHEGLVAEFIPLGEDIIEQLKQAKNSKKIVTLIVDIWTLQLTRYAQWMRRYDEYDSYNCALLISINPQDEETEKKKEALDRTVRLVFETKASRDAFDSFLYPVNSYEKFREKLGYILGKIKMDILTRKVGDQKIVGEPAISMPTIAGPGEI